MHFEYIEIGFEVSEEYMFGFGRKGRGSGRCGVQGHHRQCNCRAAGGMSLNDASEQQRYIIISNPDRKTMEMGVYVGGVVTVQKNDRSEPNIVIGVGDARYIIPRVLATRILIK